MPRTVGRLKLYRRLADDLWFEFFFKQKLQLAPSLSILLKRWRVGRSRLISPFLPPPPPPRRTRRASRYKLQLLNRQRLRQFYQIRRSSQFKTFLRKAVSNRTQLQFNLFAMLEARIPTLLFRGGFFSSIREAVVYVRTVGVVIEGRRVNRCSFQLSLNQLLQLPIQLAPTDRLPYPSTHVEVSWPTGSLLLYRLPTRAEFPFKFHDPNF